MERKKFLDLVELLDNADLSDNLVWRTWAMHLLLEIHGDLDSIAYSLKSHAPKSPAAVPQTQPRGRVSGASRGR